MYVAIALNPVTYHPDGYDAMIITSSRERPRYVASFTRGEDDSVFLGLVRNGVTVRCSGLRATLLPHQDYRGGGARFTIPRTCLRSPGSVKGRGVTYQQHGLDDVTSWSTWARRT